MRGSHMCGYKKASAIKVLHFATNDFVVHKLLADKIGYLCMYGYDIIFASSAGRYGKAITDNGHTFHHIDISKKIEPLKDLVSIYKTYKYLRREKFTIIHTHNAKAGFIGRVAAKLAGVPIIIHTSHGVPFYEGQNRRRYNLYLLLEKLACRLSDYVLSQNYEGIRIMEKHGFRPKYGTGYEGNGVDVQKMARILNDFDARQKRSELDIDENRIIIGYYARFDPVKNHTFFLDALKKVVEKYPHVLCLMAGEGTREKQIKEYAKSLGLEQNVRFLGLREDIFEIINATDIVVLASEKEGIPRVLMEAMFFKKPVVSTDVLGTRELVENKKTGFLAEHGNVAELSEHIRRLVEDRSLRIRMGEAGHERIKRDFDEKVVAERIHSVYQYLLLKKRVISYPECSNTKDNDCLANTK